MRFEWLKSVGLICSAVALSAPACSLAHAEERQKKLDSPYTVSEDPVAGDAQAEIMEFFKAKKGESWRSILKQAQKQKMITSAQFDKLTNELSKLEINTRKPKKSAGKEKDSKAPKGESSHEVYEQLLYAFAAAVILTEQPEERSEKKTTEEEFSDSDLVLPE